MPPRKGISAKTPTSSLLSSSSTKSRLPSSRAKPKTQASKDATAIPIMEEQMSCLSLGVDLKGKGKASGTLKSSGSGSLPRETMLAVNAASQAMSPFVRSGFKVSTANTAEQKRTVSILVKNANEARKCLNVLRSNGSTLQVERVASSIAQKLVALDMVKTWSAYLHLTQY